MDLTNKVLIARETGEIVAMVQLHPSIHVFECFLLRRQAAPDENRDDLTAREERWSTTAWRG